MLNKKGGFQSLWMRRNERDADRGFSIEEPAPKNLGLTMGCWSSYDDSAVTTPSPHHYHTTTCRSQGLVATGNMQAKVSCTVARFSLLNVIFFQSGHVGSYFGSIDQDNLLKIPNRATLARILARRGVRCLYEAVPEPSPYQPTTKLVRRNCEFTANLLPTCCQCTAYIIILQSHLLNMPGPLGPLCPVLALDRNT
jgi:hypothetical protein